LKHLQKHLQDDVIDEDPVSEFTARRRENSPFPTSRSFSQISGYSKVFPANTQNRHQNQLSSSEALSMFQEEFKQPMQVVQTDLNNTDSDCEGESSYKARKLIEEESGGSM
jgi:hypothetical protein